MNLNESMRPGWDQTHYPWISNQTHYQMVTLANSEDPDEMPHHAAFHQGMHCFPRQNGSSE